MTATTAQEPWKGVTSLEQNMHSFQQVSGDWLHDSFYQSWVDQSTPKTNLNCASLPYTEMRECNMELYQTYTRSL